MPNIKMPKKPYTDAMRPGSINKGIGLQKAKGPSVKVGAMTGSVPSKNATKASRAKLQQSVPGDMEQMPYDGSESPYNQLPYDRSEQSADGGPIPMGKQEYNKTWRYDNWRSREGEPVPEDRSYVFNDLFEYWDGQRPQMGRDGNPTEIAMWERNVRRAAEEAGLSQDEANKLLQDLYDLR